MSDPYKDIGFDSNRIGFGKQAPASSWSISKRALPRPFPAWRPSHGRPRSQQYGEALGGARKAHCRSPPATPPIRARATPRSGRYRPWSTNFTTATPQPSSTSASTITLRHGRVQDRALDLLQHAGRVTFFVKEGVDTVIVTGCNTSGCVRASINDAFSYGFRVIVPEPCCGDVEEGPHRDNLRDVGRRYADVVSLDEVLAYIETSGRRND